MKKRDLAFLLSNNKEHCIQEVEETGHPEEPLDPQEVHCRRRTVASVRVFEVEEDASHFAGGHRLEEQVGVEHYHRYVVDEHRCPHVVRRS